MCFYTLALPLTYVWGAAGLSMYSSRTTNVQGLYKYRPRLTGRRPPGRSYYRLVYALLRNSLFFSPRLRKMRWCKNARILSPPLPRNQAGSGSRCAPRAQPRSLGRRVAVQRGYWLQPQKWPPRFALLRCIFEPHDGQVGSGAVGGM